MCTLTWWRESAGSYEVYFNRDERKTRAMAEPPRLREREGVSFLAPIDPDGGGGIHHISCGKRPLKGPIRIQGRDITGM